MSLFPPVNRIAASEPYFLFDSRAAHVMLRDKWELYRAYGRYPGM